MKQVTVDLLNEIARRIAETMHPEKIILFGSHAWGKPGESSDIDLFIIVPSFRPTLVPEGKRCIQMLAGYRSPGRCHYTDT